MKHVLPFFLPVLVLSFCACDANKYEPQNKKEEVVENKQNLKEGDLDFDFKALIQDAKDARENAYCPYSKFKVGAAILTKSGNVYTGCNVENASYGLTVCAERVAVFKAVSAGEKGNDFIKAVAIVLDAPDYGAPCGTCRQVINEFADPDAVIVMATVNENYKIEKLGSLLPYAFKFEAK